ncbi:MAG: methylaspartate mutase subunit E [Actinobacteria bacterium]|nr:methylaspartate mutase subunit E [Actinomycetota bacterium]
MTLVNRRLSDEEFFGERKEVLAGWPTGREVDLDETVEYHRNLPPHKRLAEIRVRARDEGRTLIQPRGGVALEEELLEIFGALSEAGADVLPITIDSFTRNEKFHEAEKGIQESKRLGRSMLNGFPMVNHGPAVGRRLIERTDKPINIRAGTCDGRLLTEICFAAGFTDILVGCLNYNLAYTKYVPLERSLRVGQYVDRLTAYYTERGALLNKGIFGGMTGTMVPPGLLHATSIIEALIGAEQGVKSISLGYGQGGNLIQDVAAIRVLPELCQQYLLRLGYHDVKLTTELHQWLAGFPKDAAQAFGVIAWGAVTAALSGVTMVMSKSPMEAIGVPTKESNAAGIRTTRQIINIARGQRLTTSPELEVEMDMIRRETRAILDKVLELGDGDVCQGTVRAVDAGVIDIPFSPSKLNANKVVPVRDASGAIRYLDSGNLPFSAAIIEYHRDRIAERATSEGRKADYTMLIDDVYAVSEGMLVGVARNR